MALVTSPEGDQSKWNFSEDGYFTIPLAKKIGETGLIFVSDIDSNAIDNLKYKSDKPGLKNIHTILGTKNNPGLK